jgi:hypothetical protein
MLQASFRGVSRACSPLETLVPPRATAMLDIAFLSYGTITDLSSAAGFLARDQNVHLWRDTRTRYHHNVSQTHAATLSIDETLVDAYKGTQ